jgi:hypothetical protein
VIAENRDEIRVTKNQFQVQGSRFKVQLGTLNLEL